MFGQMRSRRRSSTPCPCNNTCRCHRPSDGKAWKAILVVILTWMLVGCMFAWFLNRAPPKRYIHVDNKVCEVRFVETGHTSTGAYWGYDVADCNEKKTTH